VEVVTRQVQNRFAIPFGGRSVGVFKAVRVIGRRPT
jgi:hypothetical protein